MTDNIALALTKSITIDKEINLDLDEHQITTSYAEVGNANDGNGGAYCVFRIKDGGTLNVTADEEDKGGINNAKNRRMIYVEGGGNLSVNHGTYLAGTEYTKPEWNYINGMIMLSPVKEYEFYLDEETNKVFGVNQHPGSITLNNVNAIVDSYVLTDLCNGWGYSFGKDYPYAWVNSGYKINVNGGTYKATMSAGTSDGVFQVAGEENNFTDVDITGSMNPCIYVLDGVTATIRGDKTKLTMPNKISDTTTYTYGVNAVAVSQGATLNIEGGTYTSAGYGAYVYSSGGTINLNGGTFNATGSSGFIFNNGFDRSSYGKYYNEDEIPSQININGGTYNTGEGNFFAKANKSSSDDDKLVVNSGTFDIDVSKYLNENLPEDVFVAKSGDYWVVGSTGWYLAATEGNKWNLLTKDNAQSISAAAVLNASDETLTLTVSGTEISPILLDVGELIPNNTKYRTVDASSATVALNIKSDANITSIKGGTGADSLTAGSAGVAIDGGDGDDSLVGGKGADMFIYTAGSDTIDGYDAKNDSVSFVKGTPPTDFTKATFNGTDFVLNLGDNDSLTFKSTPEFSFKIGEDTYSYKGNKNGVESIAKNKGITLGTAFTSKTYDGRELGYTTIDASTVTGGLTVRGNDEASSLFGAKGGGAIYGGTNDDMLKANDPAVASIGTILDGGDGNDLLIGGTGKDTFVYSAGRDTVQGYDAGDLVNVKGLNLANVIYSVGTGNASNISLDFGSGDVLTFSEIGNEGVISVKGIGGDYIYTKDYYSHGNSVTLAAGHSAVYDASNEKYETIDASAVTVVGGIFVTGNSLDNKIFSSKVGGSLYGGKGNDKLDVTERAANSKFVFKYTEGKDTVDGFVAGDKLDIADSLVNNIASGKTSNNKLTFNFDKKSDVLTFKGGEDIGVVSLQSDKGFLTKDGVVSVGASSNSLKLFAGANGKIDLTDPLYSMSSGIASVDASAVKKQSVTIAGASVDATYTFADKNKKKDQFEYGGGNVTISNYETGVDKLELGSASLSGFQIANTNDVLLNVGGKTISLVGAAKKEVLLHDSTSKRNSFSKMVFATDGVILNKEKRPTMATVSGSSGYNATEDSTVKKIFVAENLTGASITASDKAKATIDASAANGVTLIGGKKNDKLIGSTVASAVDTFVYSEGKDIIENYSPTVDRISLSGGLSSNDLFTSKISAGKRSIKFKFTNKNALTIKPVKNASLSGALNIVGAEGYTYSKNAIASGSNVSLTSEFSGSYKTKDKAVSVDGHLVKKNLTFKGTSDAETLAGGTKKTTFKGGGGNDNLIGGSGKDVFFYAKNDRGDATIADFDFSSDKLKIASGTITKISANEDKITFDMNNGRKNSANIGSFQIGNIISGYNNGATVASTATKTLIKANNTYYWFADKAGEDVNGNSFAKGALITRDTKVSKSEIGDCAVIDLGYSTNLVKSGVAVKVASTGDKAVSLPE